jgi:murein DD-endopeptidase MepM/ murein hydrolase activator NlpD
MQFYKMKNSRRNFIISSFSCAFLLNAPLVNAQSNINFNAPPTQTKVLAGETLFDIAERTSSPLIGLIKLNKLAAPYEINEGQILKIPPLKVHIAKAGETIETIGKRYSIDPRSLAVFNRLPKPYTIKAGQKIIMPAMVRDSLTGLEPQDLISLLSIEIGRGNEVSGKQKQVTITKPKNVNPVKITPPITPKPIATPKPTPTPSTIPVPIGPIIPKNISENSKGLFMWPLSGRIVDKFGEKPNFRKNDGIDIEAPNNSVFRAAASGTVVYAGNQLAGYGWLVLIKHDNGFITAYAYGSEILVAEKQNVKKGDIIGKVGKTGRAPTPRLQFQIRKGTIPVNPLSYLPKLA